MRDQPAARVYAVVGPTATGKSDLAEIIAARLGGEIVSADSMQVYRGMDVGTAKVPADERHVPYHCLDMVEPGEPYSAARYQRDAREAIDGILARNGVAVVCGGTGLYVRAALDEMDFPSGEQEANQVRERYQRLAEEVGAEGLHDELRRRDPESARLIHPHNVRRVIRALELLDEGRTTYARQHEGLWVFRPRYDARYVGLTTDREALYQRINRRVDLMVNGGLADEIRRLVEAGFAQALTAPQAIGNKELVGPVMLGQGPGDPDFDAGVEQIKTASRRYAKRQLTWFSKDPRITWFSRDPNDRDSLARIADQVC